MWEKLLVTFFVIAMLVASAIPACTVEAPKEDCRHIGGNMYECCIGGVLYAYNRWEETLIRALDIDGKPQACVSATSRRER